MRVLLVYSILAATYIKSLYRQKIKNELFLKTYGMFLLYVKIDLI